MFIIFLAFKFFFTDNANLVNNTLISLNKDINFES